MDSAIFLAYAAAYAVLLGWYARRGAARGWARTAMLPAAVILALAYDNLILGGGRFVGEGAALEGLNAARYWLTVLTPLLFVWAVDAMGRSGIAVLRSVPARAVTWLVAAGLVGVTWMHEIRGLDLVVRDEFGALSYVSAAPSDGPPLVPMIVALILLLAGAVVWKRQRWPWLFVGSLLMTVASAVEIPVASNAATNAFEFLLLVSIVATSAFQDRTGRMEKSSGSISY